MADPSYLKRVIFFFSLSMFCFVFVLLGSPHSHPAARNMLLKGQLHWSPSQCDHFSSMGLSLAGRRKLGFSQLAIWASSSSPNFRVPIKPQKHIKGSWIKKRTNTSLLGNLSLGKGSPLGTFWMSESDMQRWPPWVWGTRVGTQDSAFRRSLGSMLCCCHSQSLNNLWTRGPAN